MNRTVKKGLAGGLWLVAIAIIPFADAQALTQRSQPSSDASGVIQAVNALRLANGLPAYAVNSILMGTAQAQANYMASIGSWSHSGPGGSTVTQRLLAAGYPLAGDLSLGGFRSENVVMGPGMTPAEAVAAWTGDTIHLHTMLSPDLQDIGAGVAEADGTFYYVIDCARPTGGGVPQAYTPGAEAAYSAGLNEIMVPVSVSTPDAKGEVVHEVQPGQTLWQIAIQYGVKIDDIRRLNQLSAAYVINPGDTLVIKRLGTATPLPPTATRTPTVSPAVLEQTSSPVEPTAIQTLTGTPLPVPGAANVPGAGMAVGVIILAALVAAGLVAWAGRARPI